MDKKNNRNVNGTHIKGYNVQECAERIRALRVQAGYTQDEASTKLFISRTFYGQVEKGIKGVSVDLFIRLSQLYDASLEYLLLGYDIDGKVSRKVLDHAARQMAALRDGFPRS